MADIDLKYSLPENKQIHLWQTQFESKLGISCLSQKKDWQKQTNQWIRDLLTLEYGLSDNQASIEKAPSGKPFLIHLSELDISVAHSGHFAVFTLARQLRHGVDIEVYKSRKLSIEIMDYIGCPSTKNSKDFLVYWTRLESYAKTLGISLWDAIPVIKNNSSKMEQSQFGCDEIHIKNEVYRFISQETANYVLTLCANQQDSIQYAFCQRSSIVDTQYN